MLILFLHYGHKDKYLSGRNKKSCEFMGFGKGGREQWDICSMW